MIHHIYKIINNINDKVYIGYTSRKKPLDRWKAHIRDSIKLDRPLYRAMRKYGVDNFSFVLIYCSIDAEHTLKTMETYFINEYRSLITDCGYNLTLGGESNYGWIPSNELKKLWSQQRSGRKLSEEHKSKISVGGKNRYRDNPEQKAIMRERAIIMGCRPPAATTESHAKSAITRTGGHIHTQQHRDQLSQMFREPDHYFRHPDAVEKRKQTWKNSQRGVGSSNGNAVFAQVFDPDGVLAGEGFLKDVCEKINAPFAKFLAASRHERLLERGAWKGWRIQRIDKHKSQQIFVISVTSNRLPL
jgi:group I intron endonuclease